MYLKLEILVQIPVSMSHSLFFPISSGHLVCYACKLVVTLEICLMIVDLPLKWGYDRDLSISFNILLSLQGFCVCEAEISLIVLFFASSSGN